MSKLYVIEKPDDLIGKTIADIRLDRFSNPLMLVTTDGGLLAWITDADGDDIETYIYDKAHVETYVFNSRSTKKYMVDTGVCTQEEIDEFLAEQRAERQKEQENWQLQKEAQEKVEYERLRKKFEQPEGV
jgi:hypothetical protein